MEVERGQPRKEVGVVGSRVVRVEESQTSVLQAPASGPGNTVNERLIFQFVKQMVSSQRKKWIARNTGTL